MNTPARTVYTFRRSGTYPQIEMIKTIYPRRTPAVRHIITLATYNRFIQIANHRNHKLWIIGGDDLSWELWVQP